MKKKTSIFLFKLWVCPPIVVLGSYFIVGFTLMAFGLDDEMVQIMHRAKESHGSVIDALYYSYVVAFFVQMALSIPFIASVIYFKGGLAKLSGEVETAKMVRNNRFMFWDEIVSRYMPGENKPAFE